MDIFDAVYQNNIEALKEYLETNDVNVINQRGMSLLHYAIIFNSTEMFDLLIDNYINVNIQDSFGDTPIHIAIINNKMGFLKSLIRHGANLSIKNNDGQTPLYKACMLGREAMVYLLLESLSLNLYECDNKHETIFMALIRSRSMELLEKLALDDKIMDVRNCFGESPLHIAAKNGDINVCRYLIKNGAFVNIKNNSKETPLFYAVRNEHRDIIELLLENGAILDCKSTFGDTVYNMVPTYDLQSFINEKGEKYKTYLYSANYPLHYAIIIESKALLKASLGIRNINKRDQFGHTPLDLAIKLGNNELIELIKENL